MAKIKEKMIPEIKAEKIIESSSRRFVSDQHLAIIEGGLAEGTIIEQYDDTEIKDKIASMESEKSQIQSGFNSLAFSMLQNLMKYDIKEALPSNLTGYTFVDSLVNATNIESYTNCAYDAVNDKIK